MIVPEIAIPKGARRIGALDPNRRIPLTVVLATKAPLPSVHETNSSRPMAAIRRTKPAHITHAELQSRYGPAAASVRMVEKFAESFKLRVVETAADRRSIRLAGRAADVSRAFNTNFEEFELERHKFFAPARPFQIPANWNGLVEAVLGTHSSPHSWPRRHSSIREKKPTATLADLARAYEFPPDFNGTGQTIGLIELGGGFRREDIKSFCSRMGLVEPSITVVEIGSGKNRPAEPPAIHELLDAMNGRIKLAAKAEQSDSFEAAQCTLEVTMDVEILTALAPSARIVVYFAMGGEQGLYHAISHAVHDKHYRPSILSISWSLAEQDISAVELNALENLLTEAAHLGITVCASSGDWGALNGSRNGKPSVNYPASSPHCLACGGTSGKIDSARISEEEVWNATHYGVKGASGGGVSAWFHLPHWQRDARVPARPDGTTARGIPDVAGLADPRYGCELLITGRTFASAGTSAVAPMWAALVARLNQALGRRCGHLHPDIYLLGSSHAAALRPVLKGNNGFYRAGKGWNACVGYGTPRGEELLAHLKNEFLVSGKTTALPRRSESAHDAVISNQARQISSDSV